LANIALILTETAAAFGVFNIVWKAVKSWRGRSRLAVEVEWDWNKNAPHDEPSPKITMRNLGSQPVHVREILLRVMGGDEHILTAMSLEIKPGDSEIHRPDWNGLPPDEVLTFEHSWRSLSIIVRDGLAREWRSRQPREKPSWFYITPPFTLPSRPPANW
jgi:hypothetical protein